MEGDLLDLQPVPSGPSFRPGRVAMRATVLAALLCGLYVANYSYGWIGPEDLNLFGGPPGRR